MGRTDDYGGHCVSEADDAPWIPEERIDHFALVGPAERIAAQAAKRLSVSGSQGRPGIHDGEFEQMERIGEG